MSNRKFNKVVLSLCALGLGGAGYLIGNLIRSQPTKATIEVEPVTKATTGQAKNKQQAAAKANKAKNATKDKQQATENKTDKQKQSTGQTQNKQQDEHAAKTPADHKSQAPTTKFDTQTNDDSENKHKSARHSSQQKQSSVTKPKRQLFLTGKKTKQQYSAETIKRANQIYKHHPEWSFKACLKLARKDD